MPIDRHHPPIEAVAFLSERHLATLTTVRGDGSLHSVAVGFTYDAASAIALVITSGASQKVTNVKAGSRAVVAQVDGARWLSLEGTAMVRRDVETVQLAVARYAARYRPPRPNPERVAIEISVARILGSF